MAPETDPYFLPYQRRWLADRSRVKIWEKSRRIGATYVQAYEDVEDCVTGAVPAVWFTSADDSAAREYIQYCQKWAGLFKVAADYLEVPLFDEKDAKVYSVSFKHNGTRINALSSNPKGFRSKGGKAVLDEFAFHDDPDAMWKAARPCITWGFPLRILSTYNGRAGRYYRFVEEVKKGKLKWSLHSTPIQLAVAEGVADRIAGRTLTDAEREAWLAQERADTGDEETWLQEYCCVPVDEAAAFLTYEMLAAVERESLIAPLAEVSGGELYAGVDIGRKKDLTVIWVIQAIGPVRITRQVIVLERMPFAEQRRILFDVLSHPRMRRACIDATGLGMQLAEESQTKFGKSRVEAVTFSAKVKEDMAFGLRTTIEDRAFLIPPDHEIREDLHSVRKTTTVAGNIRFDVAASEAKGHADRFWAAALANHASGTGGSMPTIVTAAPRGGILTSSRENAPGTRAGAFLKALARRMLHR